MASLLTNKEREGINRMKKKNRKEQADHEGKKDRKVKKLRATSLHRITIYDHTISFIIFTVLAS